MSKSGQSNSKAALLRLKKTAAYKNAAATKRASMNTGNRNPIHGWGEPINGSPQTSKPNAYLGTLTHPPVNETVRRSLTNPVFPKLPKGSKILRASGNGCPICAAPQAGVPNCPTHNPAVRA